MKGNLEYLNNAFAEMHGYSVAELIGKNLSIFHTPEQMPYVEAATLELKQKDSFKGEIWHVRRDGNVFPTIMHNSLIRDKTNKPIGMMGTLRDITDLKFAENALRENEERLQTVFNSSADFIMMLDKEHRVQFINRVEPELTKEAVIGMPLYEFVHKDDQPRVKAHLDHTVQKRERQQYETVYHRSDGTTVYFNSVAVPLIILGKVQGSIVNSRDITEHKQAEKALIREKQLSEDYINSLPGLFYVFDEQRFVRWNSIWNRITGYSDEELASMYGTDFFEGKDKMLIEEQMLRVFREGTAEAEAELVTKSGQRIPYYFNGLRKRLNGKDHLIGLGIDITDLKQAEKEKRKALEFTAEHSKHALIGQVAGKMAHDFNNVLMGIMGNSQLAIMNCYDEQTKEKLERIVELAERGRDITSNLISYSKDQEPKQTYFKIEDKIELVLKMLEKDLTGIKISRNYKPGIPELLADPGMIQDVLTNIIQNSIHAMSKVENPILNLKAYSQDDKVYFEIKDNGCGIPKEHQDSIFTPAFTLKGSHDKTGSYKLGIKGTGYGMPNVKKYIVEKHKGDISLESEAGKGTRITIALRVIKDYLSSDEKKEVMKSQTYDKRKILLVEDESAIADVQYQILTKEPFNHIVSTAVNGQMAIDIFDRNEFDVISLDYMLPGKINGLDVYNHIREKDKDIPVMFVSGNIEFLESMKKLREKDPNVEHLSKPVNNLDYVNKINELIGSSIKESPS